MKNQDYLILIILIAIFLWWTRFDVYCETYPYCVAYDRFTSKWIEPLEKANIQTKINKIKSSVKKEKIGKFRIEDALNAGVSTDEIIDHLNNKKDK